MLETLALLSAGGGLLRNILSLTNREKSNWGLGDIQRMISNMRSSGYTRIGRQAAGQKQAAAAGLASQGLGGSSLVQSAIGQIDTGELSALADLEASLTQEQARMTQTLLGMQQQERMWKQQQMNDIFGSISDLGLSYLIGRYYPKSSVNLTNPYEQYMPEDIDSIIRNKQTMWNYQSLG